MGRVRGGPRDTGLTTVGITAARAKVLERLRSRHEPWAIPELSNELGLHGNTVREHLSALVSDGLAEYDEVRSNAPGRPARHYRATALGSGIDYLEVVSVLADSIAGLPQAEAFIDATGEAWGVQLAEQLAAVRPDIDLVDSMEELGFAPHCRADGSIELRSCPVLAAARRNPQVICRMHNAMVRALARPTCGEVEVKLHPWATESGCVVALSGPQPTMRLNPGSS